MAQEIVLEPRCNISELRSIDNPVCIRRLVTPFALHAPLESAGPAYLRNISKWMLRMGGITFIVHIVTGALYFLVEAYQINWAVFTMVKVECLVSLLAWHWISVDKKLRQSSDNIFLSMLKKIFSWRIWPLKLISWADKIETISSQD